MTHSPAFLQGPNGKIAYRLEEGRGPVGVWLGGYASDMLGTKAEALSKAARAAGRAFLRFDYTGHGESDGAFERGTISRWFADAEAVINEVTPGPKVLIGSSMGAWVTLLYALRHPQELAGVVLIAPAPDFTERLVYPRLTGAQRAILQADGVLRTGTSGHPAETYTHSLFVDGRKHLIMAGAIRVPCPVRILHGTADDVVPAEHVMELAERIESPSLTLTLVKGGDHRLSQPQDLQQLVRAVEELSR